VPAPARDLRRPATGAGLLPAPRAPPRGGRERRACRGPARRPAGAPVAAPVGPGAGPPRPARPARPLPQGCQAARGQHRQGRPHRRPPSVACVPHRR